MTYSRSPRVALTIALAALVPPASFGAALSCSGSITAAPLFTEAGAKALDASTPALAGDAGALKPFPVGGPPDPGPGAFYVTISGESNALTGYPFPPNDFSLDTYMDDGWQIEIDAYIVVIDRITLWANPDLSTTNQSLHGAAVAELTGPFVVDLHKGGSLVGQGGYPEQATALGVIANQNLNGNASFDPTVAYGFGFSTIPAGPLAGYAGEVAGYGAFNVNLGPDEADDYAYMVAHGASVYYRGRAVWHGDDVQGGCSATSADSPGAPSDAGVDGAYDFAKLPETGMAFRYAFATPTNYVNCQNYTAMGTPLPGEDSPRGVQLSTSGSAVAQVTVHMDHPFWESFAEDSPVHWDQIAAQYVGAPPSDGGVIVSELEDFRGVAFQPFTDRAGAPLPWRNCAGTHYIPPGNGAMFFSTLSVPVCPGGEDPSSCIRDYYDFTRYAQSTQGHLNSQGACFVDRQFPAPPGGS